MYTCEFNTVHFNKNLYSLRNGMNLGSKNIAQDTGKKTWQHDNL